jgi:cell wall-associated NlpC family hydrolase
MRSSRVLAIAAAALMGSAVLMAGAIGAVSASVSGTGGAGVGAGTAAAGGSGTAGVAGAAGTGSSSASPSVTAASEIPPGMLALYVAAAAATCAGLPWAVLAAIGTVESGNGTSDLPGVHSGANGAGAEGPMQFEPGTFAAYAVPVPPGGAVPPSPYDPVDAVYAAARMLCANGAAGGTDVPAAVFSYNHDDAYVSEVLSLAETFEQVAPPAVTTPTVGATAVAWALAQVGTPYIWGGETPGVGFDCSGLVQAAYKAAGVALPRVAQNQFDATPVLTEGTMLEPGDLVFFGTGPRDVSHVGIYIGVQSGRTMMVDAPHTGARVRVEAFPVVPGAPWGSDIFVGATRPDS